MIQENGRFCYLQVARIIHLDSNLQSNRTQVEELLISVTNQLKFSV